MRRRHRQRARSGRHLPDSENANVQSIGNVGHLFTSPFWPRPFSPDLYRPLTSLLLAVQYTIGVGDPLIFRVVSYVLYTAVSVNVYLLARRLVAEPFAFGAALLFAAHPVHVKAVALGVGQSELAVALIALIMVQRYLVDVPSAVSRCVTGSACPCGMRSPSLFKERGSFCWTGRIAAEVLLVKDSDDGRVKSLVPGFAALAIWVRWCSWRAARSSAI